MKTFLVMFFTLFVLTACGTVFVLTSCGEKENIVQFNNAVAATMQQDIEAEGVSGDIDAVCRPEGDAHTCDIYATFSDGKRQRLGDANNVRRTHAGIVWDHESR